MTAVRHVAAAQRTVKRLSAELGATGDGLHELDCGSLESVASGLRTPEHALRLIELDRAALRHLEPPALTIVDGELAVLRKIARHRVELETGQGAHVALTPSALLASSGGRGIEIVRTLARRGSFCGRLLRLLGERARDLAKLALLAVAIAALGLGLPLATELTVDRALPERSPKLLALLVLGTLMIALQRGIFTLLQQRVSRAFQGRVEAAVKSHLFRHLLRIPYPALVGESLGSWLETLQSAELVQSLATQSLLLPLLEVSMVFVYVIALARIDAPLALVLLGAALLLLLVALAFALRASSLERAHVEASAQQSEALHEILSGLATLRTCGAEQPAVLRWLERVLRARSSVSAIDGVAAATRCAVGGLRDLIAAGAFAWAGYACLHERMTVGTLLALLMLTDRFLGVVIGFATLFTPVLAARTHVSRVDALLAHEDVIEGRPQHRPAPQPGEDAVILDDVWFRYAPDQPWVLQGYSLRVPSLAQLALQGPSGAGKTTILRLIAGLYAPERGSVRVFGYAPLNVRHEIGYLPQQAHLFQGSILQNLALLSGNAPLDALHEAAEQSGLAELVGTFPMGYETVLPSGATTLSGGQRQLIAWTAAMASGRQLLLLDEALSQVDRIARIQLLAMARAGTRTLVSIEHDRS